VLLDFGVGKERQPFSRDKLLGRAFCDDHESPARFAPDPLRKPADLCRLSQA